MMKRKRMVFASMVFLTFVFGIQLAAAQKSITLNGYVLDSACAFTKNLKKPISEECAVSCAKAGSPLVILTDAGTIFWPISDAMPAAGQNDRLLPLAGKRVSVTGKTFLKGGSHAIVISEIKETTASKR